MITDFVSQVKTRGLARNNRYRVVMPLPGDGSTEIKRVANLFCDSVSLPGASLSTTPMKTFGEVREMPYEKMYEPVQMSFYVDSGMEVKKVLENWMELVFNTKTRTFGYHDNYTTQVQIYVQTVSGTEPYVVTLWEAYPQAISSVSLDTAARDVLKVQMSLRYKYWTSQSIASLAVPVPGYTTNIQPSAVPENMMTGHPSAAFDTVSGISSFIGEAKQMYDKTVSFIKSFGGT